MKTIDAIGERLRPICDRFWLFTIAGGSLMVIAAIVYVVGYSDKDLGPERLALLTSVSTGLLMLIQKVVEAQQTRRAMDQLHQSAPAAPGAVDQMKVDAESVEVKENGR